MNLLTISAAPQLIWDTEIGNYSITTQTKVAAHPLGAATFVEKYINFGFTSVQIGPTQNAG